jgi:hypothetical protein
MAIRWRNLCAALITASIVLALFLTAVPAQAAAATQMRATTPTLAPSLAGMVNERVCFPATTYCAENAFLDFWRTNGGLEILGYPIDQPRRFPDGLIRQFYERAIMEWHPENAPQYQVLLTLLGAALLEGNPRTTQPPVQCGPGCAYFKETNHTLRGIFAQYWTQYGGLPVFGYPLTEEHEERNANGRIYRVQYFERNRFEYHPENSGRFVVLLGLLGSETLSAIGGQVRQQPPAAVPDYGAGVIAPAVAALPREGVVGTAFLFIFAGLRPNTTYALLIGTDSSPSRRIDSGDFRTDANGRLVLTFDSSTTGPGFYLIGAYDSNGRLVITARFEIIFKAGG